MVPKVPLCSKGLLCSFRSYQENLTCYSETLFHNFFHYIAVQFKFIPSPNIGVYQLAHYQCSVDNTNVPISWYINETIANSTIQPGIIVNGEKTSNSSLIMTGYPQYNNTVVMCFASGLVDSKPYTNFDNATLRIQGNTLSDICHYISSH